MIKTIFNEAIIQHKNGRALLQERCAFPQISHTSKYFISTRKNKEYTKELDKEDDDPDKFDRPIKFSTSKAATYPAGYSHEFHGPKYQGVIVSLSIMIFLLYFGVLREENDIDEKMVENIPTEILEQIYGKQGVKPKSKLN